MGKNNASGRAREKSVMSICFIAVGLCGSFKVKSANYLLSGFVRVEPVFVHSVSSALQHNNKEDLLTYFSTTTLTRLCQDRTQRLNQILNLQLKM